MECKILISNGGGEYACRGDLQTGGGGFSLDYTFDGDNCRLTYDGTVVKQKRGGKMQTDMTFAEGKRTMCLTCDAESGYKCLLSVDTSRIAYDGNRNGVKLEIDYTIEGNHIILKLTAETAKEQ